MPQFDTVIKNGTIVDGTRVPRYKADVGIKNGKIAQIGRLNASDATHVLDATGLIVAPGFIDLHCHYDAQLHWDPYCTMGSWHGVTSVTNGNCGFGFAPVHAKDAERAMRSMERNEAIPFRTMQASMAFDWETFPQWMDHLDRLPLGINISQLVPVTPLVAYAMGGFAEAKKRLPNEQEVTKVVQLFHEAMNAGAVGWGAQRLFPDSFASVQRDYDGSPMISDVLPDDFYLKLARALGEHNAGCIQLTQASAAIHDPSRGPKYDFDFNARLSEESGRPVLYNAIAINDKYPEMFRSQLKWVEEANAKGIQVFAQTASRLATYLSFTFEDWNLFDNSPVWRDATLGTLEEKRAKLANPDIRRAIREEYDSGTVPIEIFGEVPNYTLISTQRAENKKYEGMTVKEIAQRENKHVLDAMLDISVADGLKTEWRTDIINRNENYTREVLNSPYTVPGVSDGGAHLKFIVAGAYPTELLTWMVRDANMITLEEAHFRLSALPAWSAGFQDRGVLRAGLAADIVIYDLANLKSGPWEVLHDLPANEWRRVVKPEGYRYIMVNGGVTFEDGKCTGTTTGKLLRGGRVA
jgi:N-acyl-D-aspartate/D-glutamate deacylase